MAGKKRVAVVGAGIAGLCIAYWLQKKSYDVTVYEKTHHIGGSIITKRENGFLIDLGPNSTLETSDILKDLVSELGLDGEKVYGNEESNKRYIVKNSRLVPVPASFLSFLGSPLFSWKAKLRLLKEPFISPNRNEDISLAEFVRRRLGKEFLDYAINPFVAGVYAGDPEKLSTAAGFPKLYALEQKYGSLIKGAVLGARERKKRKEIAKNRARLFSFKKGMETLPGSLVENLDKKINTGTAITSLKVINGKYEISYTRAGEAIRALFDKVILAVPTYASAEIVNELAPDFARKLSVVSYPPVNTVFTAFRERDVHRKLDGFGFLIPEVENRNILGTIWNSVIFPYRAPEGMVALTSFVGGTRQPEKTLIDDEATVQMVRTELSELMDIKGKEVYSMVKRWPKAIPQYNLGYQEVQEVFNDLELRFPGLYFAGNFRRGISVGDSVLSAHDVYRKIY